MNDLCHLVCLVDLLLFFGGQDLTSSCCQKSPGKREESFFLVILIFRFVSNECDGVGNGIFVVFSNFFLLSNH